MDDLSRLCPPEINGLACLGRLESAGVIIAPTAPAPEQQAGDVGLGSAFLLILACVAGVRLFTYYRDKQPAGGYMPQIHGADVWARLDPPLHPWEYEPVPPEISGKLIENLAGNSVKTEPKLAETEPKLTENFDPYEPEQPGEFACYQCHLEDGIPARGNRIIELVWGATAGSKRYYVARQRRDQFAKRVQEDITNGTTGGLAS